ncbi:bifunctional DNA primase/polymerase [Paenibacillus sp. 2KB_22]|uniref:bifunctional DNA primase/polymerase n=1 Tax=Paenibacillus sp. 2KB_22 TaxID=3232978 RepID=UPI003F98757D
MLEYALEYKRLGLPIIPLCSGDHSGMNDYHTENCRSPGKSPLIKWKDRNIPSDQEVQDWFKRWPNANLGLVLGNDKGLVALDIDGEYGHRQLLQLNNGEIPDTWSFSTPGGGMRYVFRAPTDQQCRTRHISNPDKTQIHSELAILGNGSYTVLPPSIHQNGGIYKWINPKNLISRH